MNMLSLWAIVKVIEKSAISVSSRANHLLIISQRDFTAVGPSRIVRPVAIRNTNRNKVQRSIDFEHGDLDVGEARREFYKELKNEFQIRGDIAETELDAVISDENYDGAQREHEQLRSNFRKSKMYRKHFREFIEEKEVSVLTYAEKEKIRYLHSTNPEEWTPEVLSAAFPISPSGVLKLVKSNFRAMSIKDIQNHDKLVAERIEKIKLGVIDMTPDLTEKLKMREKIPLQVGLVDTYDKNMLLKMESVKFIGEFQRLVTATPKSNTDTCAVSLLPSENTFVQKLPGGGIGQMEPDLGDFHTLDPTPKSEKELKKLKFSLNKLMTFGEFKSKMKLGGGAKSTNQEIQHIVTVEGNPEVTPTSFLDFGSQDVDNKSINRDLVHKFQKGRGNLTETRTAKGNRKARNHHTIDYNSDRVEVPIRQIKGDAVYQRGDTVYDENGEFFYKVI